MLCMCESVWMCIVCLSPISPLWLQSPAAAASASGPRRVLFRAQPDVLLLSLREELEGAPAHNGHPEVARVNGETRHRPEEDEELLQLSSSSSSSRRREQGRATRDRGLPRR